ncbi:hypothetical protein ACFE04_022558 [Oxalis oulophora]
MAAVKLLLNQARRHSLTTVTTAATSPLPIQPVSYELKPKPEARPPQPPPPETDTSFTKEDFRYLKDASVSSSSSLPVAPLPEDRALEEEGVKVLFPTLIRGAEKEKKPLFDLKEVLKLVKVNAKAKFDETVEMHVKLGINSKRSDLVFWSSHDARQVFGQGPDVGNQYKSIIFTNGAEESHLAASSKEREQAKSSRSEQAESALDQMDWIEKITGVIASLLSSQTPERCMLGSPMGSGHHRSASESSSFESSDFDHGAAEEYASERGLVNTHYERPHRNSQHQRSCTKSEKTVEVL